MWIDSANCFWRFPASLPAAFMIWLAGGSLILADHPLVFRTFMPEAGPSAFGVVLGPDLALCYDSLRGGVNQVWRGTLDLAPTLQAKINRPAAIQGTVFYAESIVQPLRIHSPDKQPKRRFKGYRYDRSTVTFEFTLDGVSVSETLRPLDDGHGLERTWTVPVGATLFFHTEPQPKAQITVSGGTHVSPGVWKFVGAPGASFTMKITQS